MSAPQAMVKERRLEKGGKRGRKPRSGRSRWGKEREREERENLLIEYKSEEEVK